MKIHDVTQGEASWVKLRLGKVTASEMGNLLTPLFKTKEGDTPRTYLYTKLAEAWRGQPLPGFSSFATERGEMTEMDARNWYSLEFDTDITRAGFCETDDGRAGCSPDGLLGDDGGLELKCPEPVNHLRYLMEGKLPPDYACQVHGSLFVTGRKWWKFVSYHSSFPKFVLTVERDKEIMEKIQAALEKFYAAFDAAMTRLRQIEEQ